MSIRIFLVDDHAVVRDGLKAILEQQPGMSVVGEAGEGREAVQQCMELMPDVVIMDISIPGLNGIEATRKIRENAPSIQVIILSMYSSNEHIFRALKAGARGYLRKESSLREVVDAVQTVKAGRRYLGCFVVDTMIDGYLMQQFDRELSPLERLSVREQEILQLVTEGKSSVEIAKLLYLSPKTVETYRSRLMRKLQVNNLPSLVKFAIQHGLAGVC